MSLPFSRRPSRAIRVGQEPLLVFRRVREFALDLDRCEMVPTRDDCCRYRKSAEKRLVEYFDPTGRAIDTTCEKSDDRSAQRAARDRKTF